MKLWTVVAPSVCCAGCGSLVRVGCTGCGSLGCDLMGLLKRGEGSLIAR